MDMGKLDKRVDLIESSVSSNEYGEETEVYTLYKTVWCNVRKSEFNRLNNGNTEIGGAITRAEEKKGTYRFRVRNFNFADRIMYVVYKNKVFKVKDYDEESENGIIKFVCESSDLRKELINYGNEI